MPKTPDEKRRDEVLLRMLKTPPTPHADMKGKKGASLSKTKAKSPRKPG